MALRPVCDDPAVAQKRGNHATGYMKIGHGATNEGLPPETTGLRPVTQ
jgi:hypothetical protein